MQNRIHICTLQELPPGARRVVEISYHEEVLVLNQHGTIYAISNICVHEGAALERGPVEGNVLHCPLHRWGFNLTSGAYVEDATICARLYTVENHDGNLFLCLP